MRYYGRRNRHRTQEERAATHAARRQKRDSIALGLAISAATLPPHTSRTLHELAAYCGCSLTTITTIQQQALDKVRRGLRHRGYTSAL
jgi:DNA-directed RNA polymerase specialized sigma24 family protein